MVSQHVEKTDLVTVTQNLLKEFGERLYNTALRLCVNPSDAEDLTFRTFEQAIRKFDTFRGEASVFSWLCSILVNFIRMDARRKAANALDFPGELPEVENEADVPAPMVISTAEEASILRPGHEREDAHHLDDFMRQVRGVLDRAGKARGRRIALGVRVCRDPDLTRDRMGMDVAKWAREGLVDLVVPHSFYKTDAGIAVAKWIACMKAANPKVKVIPGIDSCVRTGGKDRWMTPELYRGVAEKFYREGAEGLYLFNLPYLGKYHTDGMLVKEDVAETICSEGLSPDVIQSRPRQAPDVNHDFP